MLVLHCQRTKIDFKLDTRVKAYIKAVSFQTCSVRNMRGFVNYYVDEDEENYRVVRGDTDVYKFKLAKTQVSSY